MIRIKNVKLNKEQRSLCNELFDLVIVDEDKLECLIYEYVYLKTREVE